VERLFGFRYRVEIFVPPEKRRCGFYFGVASAGR
jgi:uncharacterized protein YcaQ